MWEARAMKLRRRFAGERRGRCLLANRASGLGAILRAAGIERRASPVTVGDRREALLMPSSAKPHSRMIAYTGMS
jgi:hypothetical protein